MTRGAAASVFAALVLFATAADAQPKGLAGRASLELDVDGQTARGAGNIGAEAEPLYASSMGLALRALIGVPSAYYGVGISYRLGVTDGGFAYRAELLPIGLGSGVSDILFVGVYGGVGFSGVTDRLPFSAIFPLEARVDLRLGSHVAIGGYARAVWVSNSERDDGSRAWKSADEFQAAVRVTIGKRYDLRPRGFGSNGYYLAGLVDESLGVRFLGAAIGYTLDLGLTL